MLQLDLVGQGEGRLCLPEVWRAMAPTTSGVLEGSAIPLTSEGAPTAAPSDAPAGLEWQGAQDDQAPESHG